MTGIMVAGAAGRMGKAVIRCMSSFPQFALTAAVDAEDHPDLGRDSGLLAGIGDTGVPLSGDVRHGVNASDVIIDFTFHAAVPAHVRLAREAGRPMVIGTTGLTEAEREAVGEASRWIPVVMAPNMSLGVNLLFSLVRQAAALLGMEYDVEIVETHHRHKKDAPSGTALRLAESVASSRRQQLKAVARHGREGMVGERPRGEIGIHAVRAGDAIGDHTVIFATDGERVELSHRASSRDAFAMGALRAAAWVEKRKPALYDMQDVLGLPKPADA